MYSRVWLLSILCFACAAQSTAGSNKNELNKLVQISDLIIVGSLDQAPPDSSDQSRQHFTVTDAIFIWGDPIAYIFPQQNPEQPIQFRAESQAVGALGAIVADGEQMIWFLRRPVDGTDLPQFFGVTPIRKERQVRKLLVKNVVILRHALDGTSGHEVELVIRNAIDSDLHYPEIEIKAGKIWHSPGVALSVHLIDEQGKEAEKVEAYKAQLNLLDAQDWLLMQPGEEQILRFDISDFYPLADDRAYTFEITFDGVGSSSLRKGPLPERPVRSYR